MSVNLKEGKPYVLPDFLHLNDLACETLGGKVLFSTDDFFAPAENLLKEQRPVSHTDLFTDCGKWRDGWETRRKRISGHDWCIIQLGVPGTVYGFEADTSHFAGNCAPWISIQAAYLKQEEIPLLPPRGTRIGTAASDEEFKAVKELLQDSFHVLPHRTHKLMLHKHSPVLKPISDGFGLQMRSNEWAFLVPMSEIKSGNLDTSHNYFCVTSKQKWTHIKLNIYPDGGIARLKVYGTISRDWSLSGQNDLSDLVAMANGGICVGYSNAQLGHPHNILGIGCTKSIKDGWETRRSLERPPVLKADDKGNLLIPGREWAVFRLGHPGIVTHIEIDTSHFKGNFPDTCTLEVCILSVQEEKDCIVQKWSLKQGTKWNVLLPVTKLKPHKRHFFDATAIQTMNVCTHVRLTIAPDGGIGRLRLWGFPRIPSHVRK